MIVNQSSDHILAVDKIYKMLNQLSMTKTINIHSSSSNTNVPGCGWDLAQFEFVLMPAFL